MNEMFPFLPEEEYTKAVGQMRMQFNGIFMPFRMYGMDVFIPGAIIESAEN